MNLRLDWCSHEAAKYAVEKWHYSQRMPKSKLAKIGVWEKGRFVGAVVFGVGATKDLVKRFGLQDTEGCELVRVALTKHEAPVTKIVARAIKMVARANPKLRLIVSFADPEQGHVGTIYQAGNWIFTGKSQASEEYLVNGKRWHGRALRHEKPAHLTTKQAAALIDPEFKVVMGTSKHRYLYPLDSEIRARVVPLAQPYPKRAGADGGDPDQQGGGSSILTPALDRLTV
jgi:hypothetical protein